MHCDLWLGDDVGGAHYLLSVGARGHVYAVTTRPKKKIIVLLDKHSRLPFCLATN